MSGHNHSEPSSTPIHGHDGIAYEANDVKAPVVIWALIIIGGLALSGFALMLGVQKYFEVNHPIGASESALAPDRIIPSAPQVQVHPWQDLPEMRANEIKTLDATGKDQFGRMHIPIDTAINDVVSRLKVDPNAPKGLTTPGGQGRQYSHALTEIQGNERPQTPTPAIQGEIRKNAQ
jgi:hypothetical protein